MTTTTPCAGSGDCPIGESCVTEVARYFACGVRNSFGLTLDPVTGSLWDTENGPGSYDELNRLAPGTNSGWEQIVGPDDRDPQGPADLFHMPGAGSTYSDPEFSWLSTIAPTAIVFPAGSGLGSNYDDVVLAGDFNLGQIYAFPLDGARSDLDLTGFAGVSDGVADSAVERDQFLFGSGFGGISDLKIGPDGALYVLSIGAGAIYRVTASEPPGPPASTLPPTAIATLVLTLLAVAVWRSARPGFS